MSQKKKGDFMVRLKCSVTKIVFCENCTEDEARSDPFSHAVGEQEIGQDDWEVIEVNREY